MTTKKMRKGLFERLAKHRLANLDVINGGTGSTSTGDNDYTNLTGISDCGDVGTFVTVDTVQTDREFDSPSG